MEFTTIRVVESSFALLRKGINNVVDYNYSHPDFHLDSEILKNYMQKWCIFSFMWGVSGSMSLHNRAKFTSGFNSYCAIDLP